ncbi:PREDICTED: uncharacterized protein LOC105364762 [Ceratosolen solmsi marchali]|uniref:Uncharacterized protein LOC105364762 n=1 Tax=Ceratosolen solmsi marchali TaxID=326594 RepID=A0AAJ6YN44_9HYME|nr:PREDICTED: uncharacterized protein LOC105364762 [Ceratosolen solmsi marchali]
MPKKHQVPTLQDLALKSVSKLVTMYGVEIVRPLTMINALNSKTGQKSLRKLLTSMKHQLSSCIPWHLYDKLAIETLRAIKNLINDTKNKFTEKTTTAMFQISAAANLARVISHPNLKRIEFSAWPKIMRHVLYDCLSEMTGLEVLDLGSGSVGWRTSIIEKMIVLAVSNMKNLTCFTLCFDCTDQITATVCQNCPKLQKLDVTASRSVTNRIIPFLLKCQDLKEIKLFSTSVTVPGYANLLLNHSCLEDIGRYDQFGIALEYIQWHVSNFDKPFKLKVFECRNMSIQHLYLLVEMCPYIRNLSMLKDERINDLSILSNLINVKELKLLSCDFYTNRVQKLLQIIGCNIISLHLEHVGEIDLSALVYISQYCPNLRNLVFYNCEFLAINLVEQQELMVSPFKYLERLKCVIDCVDTHLEFILSHCINIKFIHLGSSTGIGDGTIHRIFMKNQMTKLEELNILYSNDLSMNSIHLFMQNCENLRRLSELESWDGISQQELKSFREQLQINNVNLDTSPTLSLA